MIPAISSRNAAPDAVFAGGLALNINRRGASNFARTSRTIARTRRLIRLRSFARRAVFFDTTHVNRAPPLGRVAYASTTNAPCMRRICADGTSLVTERVTRPMCAILDRELRASLRPATSKHLSTTHGRRASAEPMCTGALALLRLIVSFRAHAENIARARRLSKTAPRMTHRCAIPTVHIVIHRVYTQKSP